MRGDVNINHLYAGIVKDNIRDRGADKVFKPKWILWSRTSTGQFDSIYQS